VFDTVLLFMRFQCRNSRDDAVVVKTAVLVLHAAPFRVPTNAQRLLFRFAPGNALTNRRQTAILPARARIRIKENKPGHFVSAFQLDCA
jgi:hypothetical protein